METSMKRWLATAVALAAWSAVVRADVTIVRTMTVEGGVAAMAGQPAAPKMTTHIKGLKSRVDMEVGTGTSTIADLVAKQIIVLRHDQKTAQMVDAPAAGTTSTTSTTSSTTAPPVSATVKLDASVTPTGKSQVIDGFKCDEFTFTTTMNLSDIGGAGVPPELAAMMKGLSLAMKGSMWVTKDAPGGAEYLAYQKALTSADLVAAAAGLTGVTMPGLDKMMNAMASVNGLAYLTEMTMTIQGSGPMADMMRQMGAMKLTSRTSSVSTEPISDDLLKVPDGYTIVK
jgi:hypothetical protein